MKFKSKKTSFAVCQNCDIKYEVETYRLKKTKYCGFSCKQIACCKLSNIANATKYRGTGVIGYVKENGKHQHRVVMERILGRPLLKSEIVHHKDRNKKNNSPENLEIMSQSEHIRHHKQDLIDARKSRGEV